MIKVLFIPYTFSMGGGAEKILADTVRNLDPDKYQVTIQPYADYHVKKENVPEGVTVLPGILDITRAGKLEKVIKHCLVHFWPEILRRLYIKETYDVEISFNYQIPSFLVKETKDTKTVMWNHGNIDDLENTKLKRWLQKRSYKRATKIVAISQNTEDSILRLFPQFADKLVRIYNGIDVQGIRSRGAEPAQITLLPNAFLYLGRLEEGKNPLALLEVARILKEKNVPANFYFLGQGKEGSALRDKIREYALEDRVFLLGYQQNPHPLIAQARAVCMMSEAEGFPTVFAEGMALGKPFISTPVGGVAEMSNGGDCGIVVQTPEQCAQAVQSLVTDERLYQKMSQKCLAHIENFSMTRQKENLEKLLKEL